MFDFGGDVGQGVAGDVRALVVSDAAEIGALCRRAGGAASIVVAGSAELARHWPDYIAARARTSGALVVAGAAPADFTALAEGRLLGLAARAGVVAGALVFHLPGGMAAWDEVAAEPLFAQAA